MPSTRAVVLLVDGKDGELKCIMGGTSLTGLRTGAVSGLSCRYLARKDSESLAMIGAGGQGFYQISGVASQLGIRRVSVFDVDRGRQKRLIERCENELHLEAEASETVKGRDRAGRTSSSPRRPPRRPFLDAERRPPRDPRRRHRGLHSGVEGAGYGPRLEGVALRRLGRGRDGGGGGRPDPNQGGRDHARRASRGTSRGSSPEGEGQVETSRRSRYSRRSGWPSRTTQSDGWSTPAPIRALGIGRMGSNSVE